MAHAKTPPADVLSHKCPSRGVLDHVTSLWGSLILVVLLERTYRFGELRDRIDGVSEKMLTQCLKQLQEDGFVLRYDYGTIPPKTEYSLTPLGRGVAKHVAALTDWVEGHLPQVMKNREKFARK